MQSPRGELGSLLAHRLAVGLAVATFVLILFGGLVTNTGAALAVPDWPTTFGHNMFLFPWSQMVGGVFYEHSHRLLGAFVGVVTVAVAVALWVTGRWWLRWLGVAAVLAVCVQGLLGGLRVMLVENAIAVIHGSLAQAFFGLAIALALLTSRGWAVVAPVPSADGVFLRRLALLTTAVVYLQIVLGAFVTHFGALLHAHFAGAATMAVLIVLLARRVRRGHDDLPALVRPARALMGLLLLQLLLGVGAYAGRFLDVALPLASYSALAFPVTHRLTGGLLLAVSLVVLLRCSRLLVPPETRVAERMLSSEVPA